MPSNNHEETALSIHPLSIEKELKTAFLDYAMSVIVSRALPDIRDGLKPVHRRILYAMHKLGYYHDKPFRKSATVVGEVIGHYHPHGDQAIYQSMVGMVQKFSKRYPLLDGQGNWGSIDGDNAAAMRYTEVKLGKIAREMLADIEKETVHFVPNFDESIVEPTILPAKIPSLLINGSTGIAVGMATSVPPHNLREVINATIELLNNPHLSEERLFELIPAPDFPTGGIICGRADILKSYRTGHGRVVMRGVVDVEESRGQKAIVISELPYQVNKADLVVKIAELVKTKIIEGISDIRDESDKDGIRVVIEIKRNDSPDVVLNQLYKHTSLQTSIPIIMLALHHNRPVLFTLREMLEQFIVHRKDIVTKRTEFDLARSRERAHVLEGLIIALQNIDDVIALIKASPDAAYAIEHLHAKYQLTERQAKAILEMRLQRLTGLEQDKIHQEMSALQKLITELRLILSDETILRREIIKELETIRNDYGDERKTKIGGPLDILSEADLIPEEDVVVTLTHKGYIKRVPLSVYGVQHRGGKGKKGITDLEDTQDFIQDVFVARTHDELLFFTNTGRIYTMPVFQVPEAGRVARGRAIVNILTLPAEEKIVKLLCTRDMENKYIIMVTKQGKIKKTDASEFAKVRSTGIRALTLQDGDELAFCQISTGEDSIILATSNGYGIHFNEKEVRPMGRQAAGVRGVTLRGKDYVVGMEAVTPGSDGGLLFATSRGYGKQVSVADFRLAHRGGMGVRTIPTSERNGHVIGLAHVYDQSEILLIESGGNIVRISPSEVRTMKRQAGGVRLVRIDSKEQALVSLVAFEAEQNGEADEPLLSGDTATPSIEPAQLTTDDQPDDELLPEDEADNAGPIDDDENDE